MPPAYLRGSSRTRLDVALAELGLARSRSHAAELIGRGAVEVDGVPATKAGAKVSAKQGIEVSAGEHYVSRAAHKLIAGLDLFHVDPVGRLALDVGASTGGFTQVLLERGAGTVLAIDVGHGQLAEEIAADPRVRKVEGCNARYLTADALAEATGVFEIPDLIVADLSFISLELVFSALTLVSGAHTEFVLLIKPQFEVGRAGVSGGIVTSPELASQATLRVLQSAAEAGLFCVAIAASPITGEHGNREVLAHFVRTPPEHPTEWEEPVSELFAQEGRA